MALSALAIGLTVGATVIWALIQVLAAVILKDTSISVFNVLANAVAAILFGAYLFFTEGFLYPDLGLVIIAVLGGILDSLIGFAFYLYALKKTETHVATSLSNTAPFWAVLAAILLLREAAGINVIISALLIVAGSVLMLSVREMNIRNVRNQGAALALAAGVAWGISESIPTKYALNSGMSAFGYLFVMTLTVLASWTVLMLAVRARGGLRYTARGIKLSVFIGFIGLFLGWVLWLTALGLEQASLLAPVRGLVVPFAFLFSILIVKERPTKKSFLGLLLILAGIVIVSLSA